MFDWVPQDCDTHDAVIYSARIDADLLVTNDKGFQRCLELVDDLPYRVLDLGGLVELLHDEAW